MFHYAAAACCVSEWACMGMRGFLTSITDPCQQKPNSPPLMYASDFEKKYMIVWLLVEKDSLSEPKVRGRS